MNWLLKYWPIVTTGGAILVALVTALLSLQAERDALRYRLQQQCGRIDTLERITVENFPAYSPTLYYRHAPTC